MNKDKANAALLAFDLLMTSVGKVAAMIKEAQIAGLITPEEQASRVAQVDDIRKQVGLPAAGQ